MRQDIPAQFAAEERAELERVVEALAHWPRLSGLLHYMGDKLSAGEVDHLNEYNIASEVLGRSKTVFNAARAGRGSPAPKASDGILSVRGQRRSDPGKSAGGKLCPGLP